MVSALISRVVILVFGTLYPAYSSYKAVKTKNVKEYVKWMMYWIVFALFTSVETFADVLVSWFPFYYELKIVFVIWLLSPATKGSSVLYRKFVHPELMKREEEIDQTLDKVKSQGYTALVNVGQQGLNFAVQSALTGQTKVMDHLMKKSLSMGDISQQPAGAQVSYRPANQQIPEEIDETDFRAHRPDYDHIQGGLATGDQVKSGFVQPYPPTEPHHRGYNLRSHEYHGGDTAMPNTAAASGDPSPQHYNHREIQELPISDHEPSTESISTIISVPIEKQGVRKPRPPSKTRSRSRSTGRKRKTAASKSSASATIPTTKSDKPVKRQISSTAQSKEDQRGRAAVKGPS